MEVVVSLCNYSAFALFLTIVVNLPVIPGEITRRVPVSFNLNHLSVQSELDEVFAALSLHNCLFYYLDKQELDCHSLPNRVTMQLF